MKQTANKKFLLATLAIALAFATAVVGCELIDNLFGNNDGDSTEDSSGGGSGGSATSTGSIKVVNSSGYNITDGWISQNSKTVKTISFLSNSGSSTYSGLPVGSYDILLSRPGTTSTLKWRKSGVTVSSGGTTTVTISSSGWTTN